jgi:hypothetical protein
MSHREEKRTKSIAHLSHSTDSFSFSFSVPMVHKYNMRTFFQKFKFDDQLDEQRKDGKLTVDPDRVNTPTIKDQAKTPAEQVNLSPSRVQLKKFRFNFFKSS